MYSSSCLNFLYVTVYNSCMFYSFTSLFSTHNEPFFCTKIVVTNRCVSKLKHFIQLLTFYLVHYITSTHQKQTASYKLKLPKHTQHLQPSYTTMPNPPLQSSAPRHHCYRRQHHRYPSRHPSAHHHHRHRLDTS